MTDSWVEIVWLDAKYARKTYGTAPRFDLIVDGKGSLGLSRRQLAKELRTLASHVSSDEFLFGLVKEEADE